MGSRSPATVSQSIISTAVVPSAAAASAASPAKRRRVTLACSPCRVRKAKCDGRMPTCSACLVAGQSCSYPYDSSRKRGLPTGHSQEMELRTTLFEHVLGTLVAGNPALEHSIIEILHSRSVTKVDLADFPAPSFFAPWYGSSVASIFDEVVGKVKTHLTSGSFRRRGTSFAQLRAESVAIARSMNPAPSMSIASARIPVTAPTISTSTGSSLSEVAKLLNPDCFFVHPATGALAYIGRSTGISANRAQSVIASLHASDDPFEATLSSHIPDLPSAAVLPPDTMRLINFYFTTMHSWLPVVDRYLLVKFVHTYSAMPLQPLLEPQPPPLPSATAPQPSTTDSAALRCLLWAILTIAAKQASPDNSAGQHVQDYAAYAHAAIAQLSPTPHTATVQAQILLALYYLGIGKWSSAYNLVSAACRSALAMNLYISTENLPVSAAVSQANILSSLADIKQRRRTWCACVIVDTIVAARVGKMPTLNIEDYYWNMPGLVDQGGWEEWESYRPPEEIVEPVYPSSGDPAHSLSVFDQLLKLVCIINRLIHSSSAFRPLVSESPDFASEEATYAAFSSELKFWEKSLPSYCQVSTIRDTPPCPHMLNLHLSYQLALCLLQISTSSPSSALTRQDRYFACTKDILSIIMNTNGSHLLWLLPPMGEYLVCSAVAFASQISSSDDNSDNVPDDFSNDIAMTCAVLQNIAKVWPGAAIVVRMMVDSQPEKITFPVPARPPQQLSRLLIQPHTQQPHFQPHTASKTILPPLSSAITQVPAPASTTLISDSDDISSILLSMSGSADPVSMSTLPRQLPLPRSHAVPPQAIPAMTAPTKMTTSAETSELGDEFGAYSMLNLGEFGDDDDLRLEQFMQNLGYFNDVNADGTLPLTPLIVSHPQRDATSMAAAASSAVAATAAGVITTSFNGNGASGGHAVGSSV
ncbi:fungal-specific transcription factor domain-containing protein [Limtongia smithiae]|uniref:fungal-specific transcription factor domain-containing protein n=1 Tax=Limtongia smithiae TaxID=1125753 RepID=UPI0034CD6F4E